MRLISTLICLLLTISSSYSTRAQPASLSLPEQNFEQFWQAFRDNYAFFPLKKVDWNASYQIFRPRVSAQTTEEELVAVFGEMLTPLRDGHLTISRGEIILFKGESARNTFKQTFKAVQPEFWRVAYQQLQAAGFAPAKGLGPSFKGKQVLYTSRNGTIGYLHLTRNFADVTGAIGTEAQELKDHRKLEKLFSRALRQLAGCQVLLLDLRDNGGGHSGYELAGHFTRERRLVNYKALRQPGGYEQFGTEQAFYVNPTTGPRFLGPLVVLTSDQTASAAEDLTISLARRPRTTLVGTATKGMLSDMHSIRLPNGLDVTLSNQRYTTPDGQVLEDTGVQPTVAVENTLAELQQQHDAVLQRALSEAQQLLKK
jgi:hypothetical protein